MDYTTKLAYQSNYWYNDGLNKANIRDLTGAITSLKKSLQYNRDNIASRNLLGLVYYGRGDVVEALAEWVLSKNLQPKENIANYYIQKVKEKRDDLDRINQAIKRYNQALDYCYQRCEDLAVMQLKKAIEMHPTYVKAYQLLALLYIMEEQYAEARKNIRIAHKLDKTDDITMRYMHELNQVRKSRNIRLIDDKDTGKKKKGRQTVTYNIGNETIIQPVASGLKDNVGLHTMVNIAIGVIVGVAVMGFLIMPAVSASRQSKLNKQTVKFSDQIATQKSQISALKKELDNYRSSSKEAENQQQTAAEKSRYEQMQKQRANMEKELGERTKEKIMSQIQLKSEEQKKLEIHYKTVTEAREVLEKRMTELDSVIASLTEQLKESISISAEELNVQKENFAQQKKSLSENRDEVHARLEINSDMYEKIRRQQTELLKTETRWKWMKSLSDTANGTITGKARIMLETYIQMQYFDRILARANIRLMTMSSGQYGLVRRKENKSRVGKTGLELDVVDHYNGTVRSVKTLSGGETFQASLSLALGLSDEIQSSSGGIQLDTMFVDEGFGSLDEDALDQAIRALKDLSQGSRLVGIVSHVAELKERIDKKIIVTKKRTEDGVGSTICLEG